MDIESYNLYSIAALIDSRRWGMLFIAVEFLHVSVCYAVGIPSVEPLPASKSCSSWNCLMLLFGTCFILLKGRVSSILISTCEDDCWEVLLYCYGVESLI